MKFTLTRVSETADNHTIEVNSLEDLLKLFEEYGDLVIRGSYHPCETSIVIEIYDDYRE